MSLLKKSISIIICFNPNSLAISLAFSTKPSGIILLSTVIAIGLSDTCAAKYAIKVLSAPPEKEIAIFLSLIKFLTLLIFS